MIIEKGKISNGYAKKSVIYTITVWSEAVIVRLWGILSLR